MGKGPSSKLTSTRYTTRDGTAIRDSVRKSDLASVDALAGAYRSASGASCIFNLGTGVGYSIRELLNAAKKISRISVTVKKGKSRQGSPPILVTSIWGGNSLFNLRQFFSYRLKLARQRY